MRKVLTIDGGGIKGVFPASFLATLEERLPCNIGEYFDLIVGTSTGGVVALALGLGHSAREAVDLYRTLGTTVFATNTRWGAIKRLIRAKHSSKRLRECFEQAFGDRKLGESTIRLMIPSLNLTTGEVHIYKTAHHSRFARDYRELVVDIALATCAAPTYFSAFVNAVGIPLVDGGLWANNPVGFAAVEAIGTLGWAPKDVHILSLGCTRETLDISPRRITDGLAFWGWKATELSFQAQSSASEGVAATLLGHENLMRIDPYVPTGKYKLDRTKDIDDLVGLGRAEGRRAEPLLQRFFASPADPFHPFHMLGAFQEL